MKQLKTHKLVSNAFAVGTALMISLSAQTPAVADENTGNDQAKYRYEVCHLTWRGEYKLLKVSKRRYLGHLMHHEADFEPVNGECVEEVTYEIGDTGPAGGIVYWLSPDGSSGLEAAPEDQAISEWCSAAAASVNIPTHPDAPEATTPDHDGSHASILIEEVCGVESAAGVAREYVWPNGLQNGYLPNNRDLNLLFLQKDIVGGFESPFYWSTSEFNNSGAWRQSFNSGEFGIDDKYDGQGNGVRAIRRFWLD